MKAGSPANRQVKAAPKRQTNAVQPARRRTTPPEPASKPSVLPSRSTGKPSVAARAGTFASRFGPKYQAAAILVVGVVSVAIGAFVLPGGKRLAVSASAKGAQTSTVAAADDANSRQGTTPDVTDVGGTGSNVRRSIPMTTLPVNSERPYVGPASPPQMLPGKTATLAAAIDQQINQALSGAGIPASPLAGDAEFIRRAYLDIVGHIPPYQATVAFLDSQDPYKRSKLIDELLASPEYGRHFASIWTDILVKRDFDNNKNLKTEAFHAWLAEEFNKDTGWNKIVAALLTAEGKEDEVPQTFFYLANQDNNQPAPEKLVGATGNLFMGIQVQCAQCHVHPFVSQWTKEDFWGLAAFFGHTRAERDTNAKNKKGGLATIVEVEKKQPQVKGKQAKNAAKPVPAGASIAIPDPNDPKKTTGTAQARFFEGEMLSTTTRGPYRPKLADWLTSEQNHYFAPAAVNRLWAHFFARGFVNPLEEMHDKNPPSHPALLRQLSAEFATSGYDLKEMIRGICNSNAYQRTSRPLPANADDDKLASHMPVKVLGARELLDSLTVATSYQEKDRAGGGKVKGGPGTGGNPLVRFFDTREYEDDPTEYSQGIPQLLRLMNSNLSNSSAEVAARLARTANGNKDKVIEDVFLTALSRKPYPGETRRLLDFVTRQKDANKGYAGVFWALLNSAEFTSNH